jgi:uncharacterized protein
MMKTPVADLNILLSTMEPLLNPGVFAFVAPAEEEVLTGIEIYSMVREAEGLSAVILQADAIALGLPILFRAAWITLNVCSDLQAVGFTATFSKALGAAGISCNVVAGARHDHLFVPFERGEEAVAVLRTLGRQ